MICPVSRNLCFRGPRVSLNQGGTQWGLVGMVDEHEAKPGAKQLTGRLVWGCVGVQKRSSLPRINISGPWTSMDPYTYGPVTPKNMGRGLRGPLSRPLETILVCHSHSGIMSKHLDATPCHRQELCFANTQHFSSLSQHRSNRSV